MNLQASELVFTSDINITCVTSVTNVGSVTANNGVTSAINFIQITSAGIKAGAQIHSTLCSLAVFSQDFAAEYESIKILSTINTF